MKKKLLFLVAALALFVPSVMAAEKTAGTEEELTKALSEAVRCKKFLCKCMGSRRKYF